MSAFVAGAACGVIGSLITAAIIFVVYINKH